MTVTKTDIDGVVILEPKVFGDNRGEFFEVYNEKEFEKLVGPIKFVQDNQSLSVCNVVRGLHYQRMPFTQAKLVRVTDGKVIDYAVDIRKGSPTYGKYVAVELSAVNHRQLFIPRGFAHGFEVLSHSAIFEYKCDNFYSPEHDAGIDLNDPEINIKFITPKSDRILSEKDQHHPKLSQINDFSIDDNLYE